MADKEPKISVTFTGRLPYGLMESIKKDTEDTGDFTSVSQWLNSACREYLAKRKRDNAVGYISKNDDN